MYERTLRVAFAALIVISIATNVTQAQPRGAARYLQLGLAGVPGAGAIAGYVSPRGFYTVGALLYADATPSFRGGEGSVLVSLGLGGSLRPLGAIRMIANAADPGYEIDLGLRVGQSLFFPYGESSRRRNPFSLFVEPFGRYTSHLGSGRTYFIEVGFQRPILRAGVWMGF